MVTASEVTTKMMATAETQKKLIPNDTIQVDLLFPIANTVFPPTTPFPFVFFLHNFDQPWARNTARFAFNVVTTANSDDNVANITATTINVDKTARMMRRSLRRVWELGDARQNTNNSSRKKRDEASSSGRTVASEAERKNSRRELSPDLSLDPTRTRFANSNDNNNISLSFSTNIPSFLEKRQFFGTTTSSPFLFIESLDDILGPGKITHRMEFELEWQLFFVDEYRYENCSSNEMAKQWQQTVIGGTIPFVLEPAMLGGSLPDLFSSGEDECPVSLAAVKTNSSSIGNLDNINSTENRETIEKGGGRLECNDHMKTMAIMGLEPAAVQSCATNITQNVAELIESAILEVSGCCCAVDMNASNGSNWSVWSITNSTVTCDTSGYVSNAQSPVFTSSTDSVLWKSLSYAKLLARIIVVFFL